MVDHDDHSGQGQSETLQGGPSRPPLLHRFPARWRPPAVAVVAFVLGVAVAGAVVLGWQAPTPPSESADRQPGSFDEHGVDLILLQAPRPRPPSSGSRTEVDTLQVASAFFLSGDLTSTVLRIEAPERSLDIRAPDLPVTVSPTSRYELVNLEIVVRDCRAATRWRPEDRPFLITWRGENGQEHLDRAGELDRSMATAWTILIDAVCHTPTRLRPDG